MLEQTAAGTLNNPATNRCSDTCVDREKTGSTHTGLLWVEPEFFVYCFQLDPSSTGPNGLHHPGIWPANGYSVSGDPQSFTFACISGLNGITSSALNMLGRG